MPRKITNIEHFNKLIEMFNFSIDLKYLDDVDFKVIRDACIRTNSRMYSAVTQHKPKSTYELLAIYNRVLSLGRAVKLETLIYCYGEELGKLKFKDYCDRQAYTNSFEYKSKKYGTTKDEFNMFNKSRAVTLNNLIEKYGEELGKLKFKDYCDRQAYTNSKDYLKDKYSEVNRKKGHSLDNYIARYGEELGKNNFDVYQNKMSKSTKSYSKISQDLFIKLINYDIFKYNKNYFATLDGEYGVYSERYKKYYRFDFISLDLKLCIEFHGDHYHGNPIVYKPLDLLKGRGCTKILAKDKWQSDEEKISELKILRDIDTLVVWESDYRKNEELVIDRILNYANNRI